MKILKYPNILLMNPTKKVTAFDNEMREEIQFMAAQMIAHQGVGLAANQIGINKRMFIAHWDSKFYTIINPVILETKGMQENIEGCLSSDDGAMITTRRPRKIKISYQDQYGTEKIMKVKGKLAQIFSHEIDHLDGIYYKERSIDTEENL